MLTDLYDLMYNIINPICNAYKVHYPIKTKEYPYCEFSFPNISPNDEVSNSNLLQVDIWDNKSDNITEIETITSNIYNALVDKKIKTEDSYISIMQNSPCVINLPDPELNIQRRQLRFILTIYRNSMSI